MRLQYENVSREQLANLDAVISIRLNPEKNFFVSPLDRENIRFILNESFLPEDFENAKLAYINRWLVDICQGVNSLVKNEILNYRIENDTITFEGERIEQEDKSTSLDGRSSPRRDNRRNQSRTSRSVK